MPRLAAIERRDVGERLEFLIALYRDLALGNSSRIALDARAHQVDHFDLEPLITRQEGAASRLLDLVEEFGFGRIFNEIDSPEYRRFGAFTAQNRLSTSAIFLVEECETVTDDQIARMQQILKRRVDLDAALSITTTLSENTARMLGRLRPKRFPDTKMNTRTNHLENPPPFLLGGVC